MNEPSLDPDLQQRFRAAAPELPDQAFVARITRQVQAESRRQLLRRRAVQLLAVALLVACSPWLMAGARWISDVMAPQLARATEWVGTLPGMASITIVTLAVMILRRLRAG